MRDSRERIRVVVADDHEMYRDGVVRALTGSGWIDVVGEADDGEAALAAIVEHRPDVALVDHRMPGLDGTEIVRRAARDGVATRIVVLSAFTDPTLVYGALEEGAAGYLPKETRRRELVEAVRTAADGGTVLPAELAAGLARGGRVPAAADDVADPRGAGALRGGGRPGADGAVRRVRPRAPRRRRGALARGRDGVLGECVTAGRGSRWSSPTTTRCTATASSGR